MFDKLRQWQQKIWISSTCLNSRIQYDFEPVVSTKITCLSANSERQKEASARNGKERAPGKKEHHERKGTRKERATEKKGHQDRN